jgi:hypothetical protein
VERVPCLVLGPIVEGSIVAVRRPAWANPGRVDYDEREYRDWIDGLTTELKRIAGHNLFTVYFISTEENGAVAVLNRDELAAVFAKDQEREPCPTS